MHHCVPPDRRLAHSYGTGGYRATTTRMLCEKVTMNERDTLTAAAGTSVTTPDPLIVRLDGVPSHPVPLNVTIRVGEAAGTVVVVAGPWATSELVAIGVTCYSQGAELQDKKKRM